MPAPTVPSIVQRQLLDANSATISQSVAGGLSGASIFYGASPAGEVCLRCWPAEHPSPERLSAIHAHLRMANEDGLEFVPRVFSSRSGVTAVSDGRRLWELTGWLPGKPVTKPSVTQCKQAMQAIAKLHASWHRSNIRFQTSPGIADRIGRLGDWLTRSPPPIDSVSMGQKISSLAREAGLIDREVDLVGNLQLPELAHRTISLLHLAGPSLYQELNRAAEVQVASHWVIRDIWSDHVLFDDQGVTGIIDYGACRHDEPGLDVARLTGSYYAADFAAWRPAAEYYWDAMETAGCQPLSQPPCEFDDWFARLLLIDRANCLLSALQWLEWLVLKPRQFAVPTPQLVTRWNDFLQRSLKHQQV